LSLAIRRDETTARREIKEAGAKAEAYFNADNAADAIMKDEAGDIVTTIAGSVFYFGACDMTTRSLVMRMSV